MDSTQPCSTKRELTTRSRSQRTALLALPRRLLAIGSIIVGGFAAAFHVGAAAQEVLRASPFGPPAHLLNSKVLKGWADSVQQATAGRVRVEILPQAVAPAPGVLDAIRAAKADVSIMSNGATHNPLPLNSLVEFAGQTSSAERASVAYQRVFTRYPAMGEEFAGVEVLSVFTHGPGALLLASRTLVADTGLPKSELHAGSSGAADAVRALGANPTIAPGPGAKPLLAAGKVEGTVTSIEAVDGFGLAPNINQIVMMRGGLYCAGFSLIFNKARWEALRPEDREAIVRISGESLARLAGRAWDAADAASVEAARGRGVLISSLPAAVEQRVRSDSASREKTWASAQGLLSIDAANALDEYRSELNELASAPPTPLSATN